MRGRFNTICRRLVAASFVFILSIPPATAQTEPETELIEELPFLGDAVKYDMSSGTPAFVYGEPGANNFVFIINAPDVDNMTLHDANGVSTTENVTIVVGASPNSFRVSFANVALSGPEPVTLSTSNNRTFSMPTAPEMPDPEEPIEPEPVTCERVTSAITCPVSGSSSSGSSDRCYGSVRVRSITRQPSNPVVHDRSTWGEIFSSYSRTSIEVQTTAGPLIPKENMWVTGFSAVGRTRADDDGVFYLAMSNSFERSDDHLCESGSRAGFWRFTPTIKNPALGIFRNQGNFVIGGNAGIFDVSDERGGEAVQDFTRLAGDAVCQFIAARFGSPYAPPCGDALGKITGSRVRKATERSPDEVWYRASVIESHTFAAAFNEQFTHTPGERKLVSFVAGVQYKGSLEKLEGANDWRAQKTFKATPNVVVNVPITVLR